MHSLPDQQLIDALSAVPEFALSGFSARQGLTGNGVTILEGHTYFGSWRIQSDRLVWISARRPDDSFTAESVDEAVRHTFLMILKSLQVSRVIRPAHAMAG